MRKSGTRGYSGYRGRRPSGKRWLILALILVLIAAVIFLAAQRYMVYNMDGSYRFELPWSRHVSPAAPAPQRRSPQDLEIVIEEPEPVADVLLHAQELDASALNGGMTRELEALPESVNAVAIRLKTAEGDLLYPSALANAIEAKAVTGGSIARSAIEDLIGSDRWAIARIAALHDSRFAAAHAAEAAILQKAYRNTVWYAPDSSYKLAPEKEPAREYHSAIAAEVAAMGFDELLFDEFGYPTAGRLNTIDASARDMTKQEALSLLADNLREAVSDYDVTLSVVMDEASVLAGGSEQSGQELSALAVRFDRIYVPTTPEGIPALQTALLPYTAELVPILAEPLDEGAYLISP